MKRLTNWLQVPRCPWCSLMHWSLAPISLPLLPVPIERGCRIPTRVQLVRCSALRKTTTFFGHQITPGNDSLLGFNQTLEARRADAQAMIDDLNKHEPETRVGAIAVCRCDIKLPDQETLMRVLNEELSLMNRKLADSERGHC